MTFIMKTAKQLERHFKGIANHRRIDILILIDKSGEATLDEIAKKLNCHFKTISGHTKSLVHAGLLNKRYKGRSVIHTLSPYGKILLKFIKTF
ncbi:MAG: helix-turn-helix transcriptional regulator [Patescibacteria group bacterium]